MDSVYWPGGLRVMLAWTLFFEKNKLQGWMMTQPVTYTSCYDCISNVRSCSVCPRWELLELHPTPTPIPHPSQTRSGRGVYWNCVFVFLLLHLSVVFSRQSSEIQGLHSVSAYRHGLYIYRSMPAGIAQSSYAFVGGTLSTWARWRIPVNKGRKAIRNADQAHTVHGEHADRIVGSPSW